MPDLVITPANVVRDSTAKQPTHGIAGATILAGQTVVRDTDGRYVLADADHATVALRRTVGIALHAASANQPLAVHTEGKITIGAAVVVGTTYYQSDTPGGIGVVADLEAGDEVTILGVATSVTQIDVKINNSGATI